MGQCNLLAWSQARRFPRAGLASSQPCQSQDHPVGHAHGRPPLLSGRKFPGAHLALVSPGGTPMKPLDIAPASARGELAWGSLIDSVTGYRWHSTHPISRGSDAALQFLPIEDLHHDTSLLLQPPSGASRPERKTPVTRISTPASHGASYPSPCAISNPCHSQGPILPNFHSFLLEEWGGARARSARAA